jgi:hypothetical protein
MSGEATSVRIISIALRVLLVFVTYAFLLVATAGLVGTAALVRAPAAVPLERESIMGLPVVALASAGLTSLLILRSRWSGSKLALGIGLTFFGAHTLLPELEAWGWRESLPRGPDSPAVSLFAGAVLATMLALAAVVILGRSSPAPELGHSAPAPEAIHGARPRAAAFVELVLDLASAALAYVAIYFILGCSMGWYSAGFGSGSSDKGPLCLARSATLLGAAPELLYVEAVRGFVWALIAMTIARMLRGGVIETALALGAFVALAGPVHALLPSSTPLVDRLSSSSLTVLGSHFTLGILLAFWLSRRAPAFDPRRAESHAR